MDARKCTRCGFSGSLSNFAAIGEGRRHELCKKCWVEVREDRFNQIEVHVGETELQYVSLELSEADFDTVITYLQNFMGLTDAVVDGIRTGGFVPYMQKRNKTQLVYKR